MNIINFSTSFQTPKYDNNRKSPVKWIYGFTKTHIIYHTSDQCQVGLKSTQNLAIDVSCKHELNSSNYKALQKHRLNKLGTTPQRTGRRIWHDRTQSAPKTSL